MKCVLMTRSATRVFVGSSLGVVPAAILVMEMEEVLVARMAWAGAMAASCAKREFFSAGFSGTASIMKSAVERAERAVVGCRRERVEAAWDSVMRDLERSLVRRVSANVIPRSREAWEVSTRVTGIWAFRAAT